MSKGKRVILVTDGDMVAKRAIETAARNTGIRCVSLSAGNPTPYSGEELVELIKTAVSDPIVVMVDDRGAKGTGKGESALKYIATHPDIELLGVLAVASNQSNDRVHVDCSITRGGWIIPGPVEKEGNDVSSYCHNLQGDTVQVLNKINVPIIVGIGDIGKMDGADDYRSGAPLTTKALEFILKRSGMHEGIGESTAKTFVKQT